MGSRAASSSATDLAESRFASLLKAYRSAGGLTQVELAERAGMSVRGISDLERGLHPYPYVYTVRRLIAALELAAADAERLVAAARRRPTKAPPAGATTATARLLAALPLPPTPLVGREAALLALGELLRQE